jgi:hypothetical protein
LSTAAVSSSNLNNNGVHSAPIINYATLQPPNAHSSSLSSFPMNLEQHLSNHDHYDPFDDDFEDHVVLDTRYYQTGDFHLNR